MQLSAKQYSKWLQRAMEFYIVYLSQPNKQQETSQAGGPSTPPDVKPSMPGLSMLDRDVILANPWKSLNQLLVMISERCEWNAKCVPSHERWVFTVSLFIVRTNRLLMVVKNLKFGLSVKK